MVSLKELAYIRDYLKFRGIKCCIPYKKKKFQIKILQNNYNKTRYVVKRLLVYLKGGSRRTNQNERNVRIIWISVSSINCDIIEDFSVELLEKILYHMI